MNTIHLNIGLNVAGVETLQSSHIAAALESTLPGCDIRECYIRQSATERTACIVIRWAGDATALENALIDLCHLLQQDAIAARHFVAFGACTDMLVGPKAAEWGGEFNPDFWLDPVPDNAPVNGLALPDADIKRGGWTIGFADDALHAWFERDSDGTGGGLWFSLENPETGVEDGFLHLIDYDGVFALPRPVLAALRLAGVSVDSSFE